jgi:hypothetical protein
MTQGGHALKKPKRLPGFQTPDPYHPTEGISRRASFGTRQQKRASGAPNRHKPDAQARKMT